MAEGEAASLQRSLEWYNRHHDGLVERGLTLFLVLARLLGASNG